MKYLFFLLLCSTTACSSETEAETDEVILNVTLSDAGEEDSSMDSSSIAKEDVDQRTHFDLKLAIRTESNNGTTMSIFVSVRDVESGERILFKTVDYDVGKGEFFLPEALKRNHTYEIGASTRYRGCRDERPGRNRAVIYDTIDAVESDIELALLLRQGEKNDYKGCDVLLEPVNLEPGRYAISDIFGDPQNRLVYTVSKTGRLYERLAFVLCAGDNQCNGSLLIYNSLICTELTPMPGEDLTTFKFSARDQDGRSKLDGITTLNFEKGTMRSKGSVSVKRAFSSQNPCCEESFDVTYGRSGPDDACP